MIGKRKGFSDTFFGKESIASANNALQVMRYAFTRYLRWSPDAIREKMTKELMEKLHLLELMKYIDYIWHTFGSFIKMENIVQLCCVAYLTLTM